MYTYHSLGAIKADNLSSGQEYSLLTKLSYSKSPPPPPPSHHLSPPMEKLSETHGDYDLVMQGLRLYQFSRMEIVWRKAADTMLILVDCA